MWHIESGRAVWAVESGTIDTINPASTAIQAGAARQADTTTKAGTGTEADASGLRSKVPSFSAALDLRNPAAGLQIQVSAVELAAESPLHSVRASAFGWLEAPVRSDAAGRISESYERGTDLILTFAPTDDEVRTQLYYRILSVPDDDGFGVEWIVSLQTQRLDSRPPFVSTSSAMIGGPIRRIGAPPHAWLAALTAGRYSIVELLAPVDVAGLDVDEHGRSRIEWRVDRLEKGVIRRARARLFVVPTAGVEEFARTALTELLADPPPLTT